jgi:MAF protein
MLLLASTSPFRAALLTSAGIPFEAHAPGVDEIAAPGLSPADLALSFARQKAEALRGRFPDRLVLGCDQTVEIDGRLLRKPANRDEARAELLALSGRTHQLHSALWLCREAPSFQAQAISTVRLTMFQLTPAEIEAYLDTGEWQGCAGAFRIEAKGLQLFESIDGDYHAIIGLPMTALLKLLRQAGEPMHF